MLSLKEIIYLFAPVSIWLNFIICQNPLFPVCIAVTFLWIVIIPMAFQRRMATTSGFQVSNPPCSALSLFMGAPQSRAEIARQLLTAADNLRPGRSCAVNAASSSLASQSSCSEENNNKTGPHCRLNNQYYLQTLENIPECVILLDKNRIVLYSNATAKKSWGISAEECLTDELLMCHSPFPGEFLSALHNVMERGEPWSSEQTLNINEAEITYYHHIYPLYSEDQIAGIIIHSQDISELVKTRKEAEAANLSKTQFLSNISHELRTPMIGILGAVDLMAENARDDANSENIQIIRECGQHLLEMINQILEVSKIELGMSTLQPVSCNLLDLISRLVRIIDLPVRSKGLSLTVNIDSQVPACILADEVKLQQVLSNLLYNAVKFTDQGGIFINISCISRSDTPWLYISIQDTGVGMPHCDMNRLYAPFQQLDNSSARQYGGAGVGLFICKSLVDIMNGELWLESPTNQGVTAHVRIPVQIYCEVIPSADNAAQTAIKSLEEDFLPGFSPIQILLVDDNFMTQKIVSRILQNYGFETALASNGLECMELLQQRSFDIILMDMQMPVQDGYETTLRIRNNPKLTHIPIVAMTAHSMSHDREKCLGCGCSSYLPKPFKPDDLIYEINNCLKSSAAKTKTIEQETRDELLLELIPEFMYSLHESIEELDKAVNHYNPSLIKSISHDIKGTAGMYGFHQVSRIAAEIEKAVQNKDTSLVALHLNVLHKLYDHIRINQVS